MTEQALENHGFTATPLDAQHMLYSGSLPAELLPDESGFESMWNIRPTEFHEIMMHGRLVKTPRWQQAFGKDYHYTQRINRALPVLPLLAPYLAWGQRAVDPRLNGLLLNWYDGECEHYIGKHRDSVKNLIEGTPIVTISLGEERVFRLRPWKGKDSIDFAATPGRVFVMPWETNLAWTHEVPHHASRRGRRISVTLRAFH